MDEPETMNIFADIMKTASESLNYGMFHVGEDVGCLMRGGHFAGKNTPGQVQAFFLSTLENVMRGRKE